MARPKGSGNKPIQKPTTKVLVTRIIPKVDGDGHSKKEDALLLEQEAERKEREAEAKRRQQEIGRGDITNAFRQQSGVSATRYLVEPGEEIEGLLMRANFPSKRTEGQRFVTALVHHIAKCQKFHAHEAEQEAKNLVAGLVSVNNERTNQLVEAIIGERSNLARTQHSGWQDKVKKVAFGDKEGR